MPPWEERTASIIFPDTCANASFSPKHAGQKTAHFSKVSESKGRNATVLGLLVISRWKSAQATASTGQLKNKECGAIGPPPHPDASSQPRSGKTLEARPQDPKGTRLTPRNPEAVEKGPSPPTGKPCGAPGGGGCALLLIKTRLVLLFHNVKRVTFN